ncbi:LOW QUALITY PROTEIN: glycosylphosphatidylinositol anchor attachment 1 protein [Daphnia magna]|uniref:LOW QUALITY PROTEIN: glycosylphosphatidylinositol anchor attachment 1 protein n=1 Tax=Daphnia magna TaxID=35525 RepID=UPI0014029DD3|nr:LOW QUALITY PROTEIN: glycosylphosphatidylinositol anchor attachment 1 protein [Daphnia magna]
MGLLSNPSDKQLSPLVLKFIGKQKMLSFLLYVGSIVWLVCLAYRQFNAGTYFSENALLPGLVHSNFKEDFLARQYLAALKAEAERYPNGMPHAFIAAQFKQLGLDTYTHNFSVKYPLDQNEIYSGKNVYGILRASRGASTECLVMSVPYRPPDSVLAGTNAGIAIMLSLAASFRTASYWARDIIFLVTEHEQLGVEAWLEAYHYTSSSSNAIHFGQLDARAGAIQAAINLELPYEKISHIDVRIEGLNGQLPNLDLVNLVHRLFQQERFTTTLKEREDYPDPFSMEGWIYSASSLLSLMVSQATGVPTGNHGLFHRFGIEALTVAGSYKRGWHGSNFLLMGRAIEGIMRSLNNLQERFHQSFFFYLLPATNRYISIGVYMPPFGLMIGAMLLQAVALYISRKEKSNEKESWNFLNLGSFLLYSTICGLIFHSAPEKLTKFNRYMALGLSTEDVVFGGFCMLSILHCMLISTFGARTLSTQRLSAKCVQCAILLLTSTLMYAVAMGNVSLGVLTCLVISPVFSIAKAVSQRFFQYCRRLLLILVHPLCLLFIATFIDTCRVFPEEINQPLKFLGKTHSAAQRALIYAVIDGTFYGNWLFFAGTTLYLPLWSLAWANLSNSSN